MKRENKIKSTVNDLDNLHIVHFFNSLYYFIVFLHPVLFLIIDSLDQAHIIESAGDV